MSDLISRQAAIDVIKGLPTWNDRETRTDNLDYRDVVNALSDKENLPSAERRGWWIDESSGYTFNFTCSNCDYVVHHQYIKEYKHCPNCGARMDGE